MRIASRASALPQAAPLTFYATIIEPTEHSLSPIWVKREGARPKSGREFGLQDGIDHVAYDSERGRDYGPHRMRRRSDYAVRLTPVNGRRLVRRIRVLIRRVGVICVGPVAVRAVVRTGEGRFVRRIVARRNVWRSVVSFIGGIRATLNCQAGKEDRTNERNRNNCFFHNNTP